MKRYSSQYTITNAGNVLKRAIITVDNEGRVTDIEDTGGDLKETESIEFYNGIIVPGFVNCHCHLELSHLRNLIPPKTGLHRFIEGIRNKRIIEEKKIITAARAEDSYMFKGGISACADICNNSSTFAIKQSSAIKYINLIEVFGIDPVKAQKRMGEALSLASQAKKMNLFYQITPHSAYSVSPDLFNILKQNTAGNKISSIHFLESPYEREFLENHTGPIIESYIRSGLICEDFRTVSNSVEAVMNYMPLSGNLILVHNTFVSNNDIEILKKRNKLFYCLCPNSNIFIENKLPPLQLLLDNGCEIVIGTDSLASNRSLSIIDELKTLQFSFPELNIPDLIKWATVNGARALGIENEFGIIEKGRKPGLLLLEGVDLQKLKLTDDSSVTRLV
ncbi:MAG TPA: amidohydrolase family protein [Bacteroidales bacterium]|nr:amidohydrolase family protein [Bacteroidales bacterium]